MQIDDMEEFWITMKLPGLNEEISGRRLSGMPSETHVYLALDREGFRHLFIQVDDTAGQQQLFRTRGLDVSISRFKIGTNPESFYVDFFCSNQRQNSTFTAVAADVIRSIRAEKSDLLELINGVLARWRDFWTASTEQMTQEEAVGLFGELWFLLRWFPATDSNVIGMWQRDRSALHDFQGDRISVEVKTANSRTLGAPFHHISGIDQLEDPEQGQLYLFSLQVTEDALSGNTLHSLVKSAQSKLWNDYRALSEFNEKIVSRGYTLDDSGYPARGFRILSERLYSIGEGFPRIIRRTFGTVGPPAGTSDIRYTLDMAACDGWLIARNPEDNSNPLRKNY